MQHIEFGSEYLVAVSAQPPAIVTIRTLTTADLDRVVVINEANVPDVGPADRDHLRFLVEESELALVAELADTVEDISVVAGFCLVLGPDSTYQSVNYRWFMDRYDDAFYLDRVAFDATYQGMGLGTQLYAGVDRRIAERRADGAAIDRLTLEVNVEPPNHQSLAFHSRRGFVEVGRQPTPYGITVSLQEKRYSE